MNKIIPWVYERMSLNRAPLKPPNIYIVLNKYSNKTLMKWRKTGV